MFIPSYRLINFEEFFQHTCLFRPTGLLILSNCFHPTGLLFWGIFQHTYMFIPPYRFINFDELFPHTYMIGRRQQTEISQHQGRLFWITCNRPKLLRKAGCLQLIQNSTPSVALMRQCCIRIVRMPQNLWKSSKFLGIDY